MQFVSLNRVRGERGVSTLEAALILPVFIFIVYMVLEVGRFFTYQGILNASAQRAASLASVVPDLDSDDPVLRGAAEQQVIQLAGTLPQQTFFAPSGQGGVAALAASSPVTFSYTQPGTGQSRTQVLLDNPMTITVTATVQPILSFAAGFFGNTLTLRGIARVYREPRNTFSEPQALDCLGNPIATNGSGSNAGCPCPSAPNNAEAYYNPNRSQCRCVNATFDFDPTTATCVCPTDYARSGPNCVCALTGADCLARGQASGQQLYFDPSSCSCQICWWPKTVSNGGTTCACAPAGTNGMPTNAQCAAADPNGNAYYDTNWGCGCRSCGTLSDGVVNGAGTMCACAPDSTCPNNQRRASWLACRCGCDGQLTLTAPNGQPSCAPSICATSSCTYDTGSGTWTVGE